MATKPRRAAKTRARKPKKSSTPTVPDLTKHPQVRAILGDSFLATFNNTMQAIEWGEEEIAAAMRAQPEHADRIWHSFKLLTPTHKMLFTEFVYRSHARELLARVVAGGDTRLGTAAECCVACSEMSLVGPLNVSSSGLYWRMWRLASFPEIHGRGEHSSPRCTRWDTAFAFGSPPTAGSRSASAKQTQAASSRGPRCRFYATSRKSSLRGWATDT